MWASMGGHRHTNPKLHEGLVLHHQLFKARAIHGQTVVETNYGKANQRWGWGCLMVIRQLFSKEGRSLLGSFYWNNHTWRFHRLKNENHIAQHNKQRLLELLPSSFLLNGYNMGFHPLTEGLETLCVVYGVLKLIEGKYLSVAFTWLVLQLVVRLAAKQFCFYTWNGANCWTHQHSKSRTRFIIRKPVHFTFPWSFWLCCWRSHTFVRRTNTKRTGCIA